MFKASFEDEIYRSMEQTLVKNQVENTHGFQKLAQAVECLNAAAEIFEQAGMPETANDIIVVLQSLADEQSDSNFATEHRKCSNCSHPLEKGEGDPCDVCKEDEEKAKAKAKEKPHKSPFAGCDHYWLVRRGGTCPDCHRHFKGNYQD